VPIEHFRDEGRRTYFETVDGLQKSVDGFLAA
jgi:hypothetical protein